MTNRFALQAVVIAIGFGAASLAGLQLAPPAQAPPPTAQTPGKAHLEIPDVEAATCLMCHEGLDQAPVPHAPVAAGMCTTCHEFSGTGEETKVALVGGAVPDNTAPLCLMCHDDVAAALKTDYAHAPAASGDCAMCHSPHGSDHERLLKTAQMELCTTCHDDVAEQLKLAHPHAPVKLSCAVCHDPHGSAHATKLREATNELCLACHLLRKESEPAPGATLFGREIGPDVAHLLSPERVIRLDRLKKYGHPLMSHPVAGPKDPVDPTKPFTCLSCHLPHGADGPALQRYATENPSEACVKCH